MWEMKGERPGNSSQDSGKPLFLTGGLDRCSPVVAESYFRGFNAFGPPIGNGELEGVQDGSTCKRGKGTRIGAGGFLS